MPVRPRSVVIDGIRYVPADAESTTELRLGLWRSMARRQQETVTRLTRAIEAHRQAYLAERTGEGEASWVALDEADRKLWDVLSGGYDA